jgi:peptide/nickel transport system substrate-binding protein
MKVTRNRRALVGGIALATLAALSLTACSSDSTTNDTVAADQNDIAPTPRDQVADGGTLKWPIDQTIPNFNYNQLDGTLQATVDITNGMLPATFNFDAAGVPSVNKDYFTNIELTSTSPQVVTYTINPEAKWNDGSAISAADLIAQWKALNGTNTDFNVSSTTGYENIKSVAQGENAQQAVVTFKTTYADWQALFTPLFPNEVNASPEAFNTSLAKDALPVSAGPFKLESFNATQQAYTAVRDDAWWGEPAKLDKIIYRVIDPDAQVQALANGEIDFIDIGPDAAKFKTAAGLDGVTIRRAAGPNFRHITFNGEGPILKDLDVRTAVAKGINRQQIADALLKPLGTSEAKTLGNHIFMTNQRGYVDNSGVVAFNPDEAKSELDAAGWTQDGDFRSKDGKELTLNLLIPSGVATATSESALIQQQLKAIGVNVKITSLGDDFFDAGVLPGKFDLTIFTWVGTPFPISSTQSIYAPVKGDDVQQNYGRISSDKIGQLYEEVVQELDQDKAIDLANQIDVEIWTNVHSLTTYQRPDLKATNEDLVNYGALGFATVDYADIGFKAGATSTP